MEKKAFKINTSARWEFCHLAFYQADGDIRYENFEIHALPVEPMEGLRPVCPSW